MLAQINEVKEVFTETAGTFGLAVAILVVLVISLAFIIWMIARYAVGWLKPMIEGFFAAHLETMRVVREGVESQADSMSRLAAANVAQVEGQKAVARSLEKSNNVQTQKLDELKKATDQTNKILTDTGRCQANQVEELIRKLHPKGA